MSNPVPSAPTVHEFQAVAICRLAALAEAQNELASQIEIVLKPSTSTRRDDPNDFACSAKLIKQAAQAASAILMAYNSALAGNNRAAVQERLIKLGVPATSAALICDQLTARRELNTRELTSRERYSEFTAVLNARGFLSERI